MSLFLGLDTSNYTTSGALYDSAGGVMHTQRKLLSVKNGAKGLRQSEAVYQHVKNLPIIIEDLLLDRSDPVVVVAASSKPRDLEGSYMPCFEPGLTIGRCIASSLHVPFLEFSHQAGHIAAALFSLDRLELLKDRFIAFHVSGGTTEAVLCSPGNDSPAFKTTILTCSLDLKAGQAVDRVGVMLGLSFPAGPELEKLALQSTKSFKIKPVIKGNDCCLSGVENLCSAMLKDKADKCDIARFCVEYIKASLDAMTERILLLYPGIPLLFAGGVMSNSIIKEYFTKKYGALFAKPVYSSDNAAGIAMLASLAVEKQ